MSDDDWENQLDSDNEEKEKQKEEEQKKASQDKWGEKEVDVEAEAKRKAEEKKRQEEEAQKNARMKDNKKKDYDKEFDKRVKKLGGGGDVKMSEEEMKGMSAAAVAQAKSQAAETGLVDALFAGEDETESATPTKVIKLNSQKDYEAYGKDTAKVLYGGAAPYRIESFFRELTVDLGKHADGAQMKQIAAHFDRLAKEKLKQEKSSKGNTGKKGGEKAVLKGGGGKGYDRNNNPTMVAANIGGDDYGEYGEEEPAFTREGEADHDFM